MIFPLFFRWVIPRQWKAALSGLLFALAAGWAVLAMGADADELTLEHRVKAAFLYQFAGYVEWPPMTFAQPGAPLTIAVLGAAPLAAELSQVAAGRSVGGRPVTVRRINPGESLAGVHVLFIGRDESVRLGQLARNALHQAILTVTETDGALDQGSMINFVVVDRRVRFEVALDSAEKGGLKLSSRLLAVARQVRTGAP
jgi:hypothetical protein